MQTRLFPKSDRGLKDIGWLQSNFYFSFSTFADPTRQGFGLLKVVNDDFVAPGNGFGLHPHQNMEIISVMLAGSMNHKDSMGYSDTVHADWVQIMSAGSGLRHEEHNVGQDQVNFLQIWIEPRIPNITPRYQRRHFPREKRANQLTTIISNDEGVEHCWINQNARLSLGYFTEPHELTYRLNPTNKCVWALLLSGKATIAGQRLAPRDAVGIWQTDSFQIQLSEPSEFLLIEVPING